MHARAARRSILLTIALAACATNSPSPARPGNAAPSETSGDPSRPSAPLQSRGTGPLTEAECIQLLDHYLDLAMSEKRATLPPDQVPTEEQIQRIRTDMRADASKNCIGKSERKRYDCVMQAKTTRGIGVCFAGESDGDG